MTGALSAAPIAQARATYNTSNPRTADTRTHVHYINIYAHTIRMYTYFYFTVILLMRFYRCVTRLVIVIIIIIIIICFNRNSSLWLLQLPGEYSGNIILMVIICGFVSNVSFLRHPCVVNRKDLVYNLNGCTINQNINKTEPNTKYPPHVIQRYIR